MDSPTDSGSQCVRVELPRNLAAGANAREVLERHYGTVVRPQELADAQIVTTELVNNAVLHGAGSVRLTIRLGAATLRIEVADEGTGAAVHVSAHGSEQGGHGLRIVQALSTSWGAFEGTTHVWAELPLHPD